MDSENEKNKEVEKYDDGRIDFEYMDRDVHIQGRITKKAKEVMDGVMGISLVVVVIGIIMLICSDSGSGANNWGIGLVSSGGLGVLIIAPLAASFFE